MDTINEIALLRKIFDTSLAVICTANQTHFTYINPAMSKILDYDTDYIKKTPFIEFVHPDDIDRTLNAAKQFAEGEINAVVDFENRYRTKSGSYVWFSWYAVSHEKDEVYAVATNVTTKKKLETDLEEKTKQLQKINAELEQFAYIASHDLKAPLRAIANLTNWLAEDLQNKDLTEENKKHLSLIQDRIKKMNGLIEGILQYSRIGRIYTNKEVIDLSIFISEIINNIDKKQFTINIDPLPKIMGNKITINQLFQNLIVNGIMHHTRNDGKIDICVKDIGKHYEFSIQDDGPGIPKQFHNKLFTMFQTLAPKTNSTGIGLALCKKIVDQENCEIWIDSDEGLGAKFIFTWPKLKDNV